MNGSAWKIPAPSPLILIADDLPEVLANWVSTLTEYGIACITASSLESLNRGFTKYRDDISAIILDGCIPGHEVNTIDFIRMARASGFNRPIVAASSSQLYRWDMMTAGCSHEAPKQWAAHDVADLLTMPA